MSRSLTACIVAVLTLVLVVACVTSPTGRRQLRLVSDAELSQMGAAAFQQMKTKTPPTRDPKLSSYVNCVTNAVTATMGGSQNWEVQVFDDKQINAFALPGGKIGVFSGMLKVAKNQDQLAAVIGHEVAHVLAGHSASRVSNEMAAQLGVGVLSAASGVDPNMIGMGANLLLLLPFSRGDEVEADILGQEAMARAGFDPRAAIELWRNMAQASQGAPPEFMSTHPAHGTRIQTLERHLSKTMPLYEQARSQGRRPDCR